jgi:hypothetical protein
MYPRKKVCLDLPYTIFSLLQDSSAEEVNPYFLRILVFGALPTTHVLF